MKYLFLVKSSPDSPYNDPDYVDPEDESPETWVEEHDASGARILGDRVRPAEDATTVRFRKGELLVTDGPFVEGKDYIAGFDVIEAADLDEAISIAAKHPVVRAGLIEIRPFWPFED